MIALVEIGRHNWPSSVLWRPGQRRAPADCVGTWLHLLIVFYNRQKINGVHSVDRWRLYPCTVVCQRRLTIGEHNGTSTGDSFMTPTAVAI